MSDLSLPLSGASAPSVSVSDSVSPGALPVACVSCGARLAGEFCHGCGQRARRGRFTLRGIATHLVADAFDLNHGLLFTVIALSRRPGPAIREYVDGATVRYANPVKYLVVVLAITVFLSVQVGVTRDLASGMTEDLGPGAAAAAEKIGELLGRYMNVIMAAAVPFMAAVSRLLFRRAGLNFAEHLIFNVYVYAQQCLLYLFFLPFTLEGAGKTWGTAGYFLLSAAYYAWAATVFFGERPLPGVVRSLAAAVLGSVLYYLAVGFAAAIALASAGVI